MSRIWVQITSGQGPAECCWVVARVAEQIKQEVEENSFQVELLDAVEGEMPGTFKSILLALEGSVPQNICILH